MEESSEDRKARLAALRKKRKAGLDPAAVSNVAEEKQENPEPPTMILPIANAEERSHGKSHLPPSLKISEDETVEFVAARVQEEIFERIHRETVSNSNPSASLPAKQWHTKDLEADIEHNLKRAQLKTDQAVNRIIRKKYAQQSTT